MFSIFHTIIIYLSPPSGLVTAGVIQTHHPGLLRWKVLDLEVWIATLDFFAKTGPRSILITWKGSKSKM